MAVCSRRFRSVCLALFLVCLGCGAASAQASQEGLVASYSFDDEGDLGHDSVGGHDGEVEGAGAFQGIFGTALEGTMTIPASPDFDLGNEFTVEAWILGGGGRWEPVAEQASGFALFAAGGSPRRPQGFLNWAASVSSEQEFPIGSWTHLAFTAGAGELKLYIDGKLVGTSSSFSRPRDLRLRGDDPISSSAPEDGSILVGEDFLEDRLPGAIDELRIYNRPLSAEELFTPAEMSPPTAVTEAASNPESDQVQLNGIINAGGSTTSYYFEYGPTTSYGTSVPMLAKTIGASTEQVRVSQKVVATVRANATYHYRIVAKNKNGIAIGKDQTFKTGSDDIPPTVTFASKYSANNSNKYVLHIAATDSGGIASGIQTIDVLLNGQAQQPIEEACLQGQCPLSVQADWSHEFEHPIDGTDHLQVVVHDGSENTLSSSSFSLPSRVVHATLYNGSPSEGGQPFAQEWAQPDLRLSRRETSSEAQTRNIQKCDVGVCVIQRKVHILAGESEEGANTAGGDFTSVEVPVAEAGTLSDPATMLAPSGAGFGRTVASGLLSSIAASWQTLPPGSGLIYELVRSSHVEEEGEPAASWEFWIDSNTKLPVKARFQEGNEPSKISYYSYEPQPVELGSLPEEFFELKEPQTQATQCSPSATLGGWKFSPFGAVFPDSRFDSVVKTADGDILLVPEGGAKDGPMQRATLTAHGVELSTGVGDTSPLKWQITFEPRQRISFEDGTAFVERWDGVKVAEISAAGGKPDIEPGSPFSDEELSSGDRIVVHPGQGAILVSPVRALEDPPCISQKSVAEAKPEEEAAKARTHGFYSLTQGNGTTAQIKVWVDPHPGVGNVKVALQGPCTDHEKFVGADGWVLFGGCKVGRAYIVSVPEFADKPPNHYQLVDHVRNFTLFAQGRTMWFDYHLIRTDSSPPPPPEEEDESASVIQVDAVEPENGEAGASTGKLPPLIEIDLAKQLKIKACAAAAYIPDLYGNQRVPTIRDSWYLSCRPTSIIWVELLATLEEADALPKGHPGTWHVRDRLGPKGRGVGAEAQTIQFPKGAGPFRVSSKCLNVNTIHLWRNSAFVLGFSTKFPDGVVLGGAIFEAEGKFCG